LKTIPVLILVPSSSVYCPYTILPGQLQWSWSVIFRCLLQITDGQCTISAYESLRRHDKRKDRVEISYEQLTEATEKAEAVAKELNRPLRIVGWYHSHPHITVFPSHVGKFGSFGKIR